MLAMLVALHEGRLAPGPRPPATARRTRPTRPRRERRAAADRDRAATVLATGLGALPVIALGSERARAAQGVLSGLAAGVMAVAADRRAAVPAAEEGSAVTVVAAAAAGALALVLSRRALNHRAQHNGRSEAGTRSLLVIGVLFAHSLPGGPCDRHRLRLRPGRHQRCSSSRRSRSRTCRRAPRPPRRCSPPATAPPSSSGAPS